MNLFCDMRFECLHNKYILDNFCNQNKTKIQFSWDLVTPWRPQKYLNCNEYWNNLNNIKQFSNLRVLY